MGGSGIERHVDARVALLTPAGLTALIGLLQIGKFCRKSSSLGGGAAFTLRRRLRVIELLSASIKIHSYLFIYRACVKSLSNEVVKLLKCPFSPISL